jgi:hypothetical protein
MLSAISRRLSAARNLWRRLGLNDAGSVATMLIAVPVIAGTVAIGVETGQLYRVKRQMQGAADAAALAGTVDSIAGKTTAVITSDAQYEAQRNGFTNGSNGVVVTVNSPPTSGPNVGTPGAVEVIITKTQTFSLGAVLLNWMGRSNNGVTIGARSVAAQGTGTTTSTNTVTTTSNSSDACIIALTPNNEQGVSITNMNNFGTDCSVISNATATGTTSSTSAIDMSTYNGVKIDNTAGNAGIWTRGSFTTSDNIHFAADFILQNQTTSVYDPYSTLATPSPGSCTYTNYNDTTVQKPTLTPGTYCGGMRVVFQNSDINFAPGTYYIANGDMVLSSGNNISCKDCTSDNGVTFVLTQTTGSNSDIGGVSITSENNVTLNAGKNNSPYPGVLFYQDRRATAGTMTSTSKIFTIASLKNATINGAVYFPQNRIDISTINNIGGTPSNDCTVWIGRYIKFSNFNNNYKGGCTSFGTTPAGVTTTTTSTTTTSASTTRNKVLE